MKAEELTIQGMTCGHCVMSVKKELQGVAGLDVLEVEIGSVRVRYDESKVKPEEIARAIEAAGYKAIGFRELE